MIHGPAEYSTGKVDGDRHSHVLVYHGPLLFATFWELLAIYFHYGVTDWVVNPLFCKTAELELLTRCTNRILPDLSASNPEGCFSMFLQTLKIVLF